MLSIAVENDAGDAVLNCVGELLDGAVVYRCPLAEAAADNDEVWALLCHGCEYFLKKILGPGVCRAGEQVGSCECCIVDAFGRDGGSAECLL